MLVNYDSSKIQGIKIILRGEALIRQKKFSFHKLSTKIPIKYFLKQADAIMYSCTGNYNYWKSFFVAPYPYSSLLEI